MHAFRLLRPDNFLLFLETSTFLRAVLVEVECFLHIMVDGIYTSSCDGTIRVNNIASQQKAGRGRGEVL